MDELIDQVDEENNVIGVMDRAVVRARKLPRRIVHLFVVNSKGEVYFHRIAPSKPSFGGLWASSASGYVKAGESYEAAAKRELEEELGIASAPLTHLGNLMHDFDGVKRFIGLFLCVYDGTITPDPREIAEGKFFTREEAERLLAVGPVVPSLRSLYNHLLDTHL